MFDFNVICYEENGTANIEYSIDGKTCIDHNYNAGKNIISITPVDENNCKDISFSELNHNDDGFIVKKMDISNANFDLICYSMNEQSLQQNFIKIYIINTIQSKSIQQVKTVSLLI